MNGELQEKLEFGYAQVGRVRLHYARAGSGPELILLLHGFPEFWYGWRHQLIDLSDEYTVVAPDLRGVNLSDKPPEISEYELPKLVDDVIGMIYQLGFEKAHIVGHDWGGGIAWAVARRHPGVISRLVVLQTPPSDIWRKNLTVSQLFASWYMFFFQLPRLPEMMLSANDFDRLEKALRSTTAERGVFTDQDIEEYKICWSRPGAISGAVNIYRANILKRLFGKKTRLPEVMVPTMFIYGEQDHAILPGTVEGIPEVVSSEYEEVRIPEAAHWVQAEAREKVSQAIRQFVKR